MNVASIDRHLVNRTRARAKWWRDMHGPNDLDEEIYDETADALEALAAERKQLIDTLKTLHNAMCALDKDAFGYALTIEGGRYPIKDELLSKSLAVLSEACPDDALVAGIAKAGDSQ